MLLTPEAMKRLLKYLILGTRGGYTRAQIIQAIRTQQLNAHQLAEKLEYDYSTIRHHLGVLTENSLLVTSGDRYGQAYSIGPELADNFDLFLSICGNSNPVTKEKPSHKAAGKVE